MTEPLRIDVVDEGREVRLVLTGELTYSTVALLAREVEQVLGPFRPQLLLDVARLHFCDSIGLSALLRAQRRARLLGGAVVLSGVHGCLQRVLRVTGADALFTISGPRERADTPAARSGSAGEPA